MTKNTKRERILKRLDEGASPTTIHREFGDRLEACGWLYILKLKRERENNIDAEIARKRLTEIESNPQSLVTNPVLD